jgi:predicted P-loop ATPase
MEAAMLKSPTTMQWRELGAGNKPKPSLYNARIGIMAMKIICRHDLFRDVTLINYIGDQHVHQIKPMEGKLTDAALLRLRQLFSERYGFDPEDKFIRDAVKTLALENCFDPILDLLDEAQRDWDQKRRLDTWVIDYLKCEDTPLNRAIGRKLLVAAVRRARDPGAKFDNIGVLEGEEGWNKSTTIRVLAGDDFFSDQNIIGAKDKEVQEQLAGVWMHEMADLTGMKKADVDHVKSFASRQYDRARPAYGHTLEWKPRRSIDWATTNDEEYLQSQTGNRRFWPLACGVIDIEALRRDRLQLLGEAAHYESFQGESLVLDEVLWGAAKNEQEKRRVKHPWEDILANIPDTVDIRFDRYDVQTKKIVHREYDGCDSTVEKVSSAALLTHVLKIPEGQQVIGHSMRLATCMKKNGWERPDKLGKLNIDGQQERGYFRRIYQHDSHVAAWRDHQSKQVPF